jgi:hypothetical protein
MSTVPRERTELPLAASQLQSWAAVSANIKPLGNDADINRDGKACRLT